VVIHVETEGGPGQNEVRASIQIVNKMSRYLLRICCFAFTFAIGVTADHFVFGRFLSRPDADVPVAAVDSVDAAPNSAVIGVGATIVCNDEDIKPVWDLIVRDSGHPDEYVLADGSRVINCRDEIEVQKLPANLNGSKLRKVAIKGKWSGYFCGKYSNCWFGIFEIDGHNYKPLFINRNVARFTIKRSKHFGYRDLITYESAGANGEHSSHYRHNGVKYQLHRCFQTNLDYYYDKNGELKPGPYQSTTEEECSPETEE